MFSVLKPLPTDPILGLMAAYKQDTNPNKIDLGVGVYKDELGNTPVLKAVKKAEAFRLENETSKSYIGLAGNLDYCQKMESLLLGEHKTLLANRVRTAQAPGGTGALRVAAEFIMRCNPKATVWVTTPTWANHISLFEAAGLTVKEYPYYDYENKDLLFDEMINTLKQVPKGDVVLLHACCHNPSGMDLNEAQWKVVAELAKEVGFTPLVDIAYQGFGSSLEEDARGLRILADAVEELIICSSCSKNFGLYRERIGACSLIAKDSATADISNSVLLSVVRSIYSMPPAHGADIVNTILSSTELTQMWHQELDEMRSRINGLRTQIKETLATKDIAQDFSFIERQHGMFSFLGINKEQITRLQKEYGIYIVGSSRVNVAGVSDANIEYFANAVADVCKS
ncbi:MULTISPECIES: aromatic amino acid transaminase [Pseudoalteromonas]|uniref:Aminotransferase n=3 Tax=Pseudoalteromonas TaxID=53246 RepID=Q3IED5_PSET1|nr:MULTISPECIES: aromatic amino acid transaminase [Pseudoalteromonas]CAA04961.1 aspartate aminotransferase [Moraxella sp.]ASM53357.1 aspartate aminotransferase [Pseudoalteromonas nigrifaciens]MBB1405842.1 aspartate/tyrosine/aromatic aminotransferase [Pseudoalteromonas sp. SG44-5]MBH0070896.1 aspartate/tyrosine/aromatic aminotransferase [Pseudoalteromonas sp. NZS127]MBH0091943.1 aspartate/tyrosine/aromatic aminotransferase [Pseudoalteromonas sp. SCQQ13]|tara:strand:+ start:8902 stop:10095 length:1194 start_codon:yes stop_codon:yes gene_type:complete